MERIDQHMHEIRRRFVRGLLMKLPPAELRAYVTGFPEDEAITIRRAA
ncbi:MAG: hypothetical protein KF878_36620 [Planctomycetes bacterium]|nr:hypothetical protein [Planctomycetota bacterium]MCW8139599.1 hypothetical protein [Planctomycetota bacterium]